MKKVLLSLAIVIGMSSFTSPSLEKMNIEEITVVQLTPSDCVRYARNIVLGYAAANNMDYSRGSDDYQFLMNEYKSQYRNCLEDIGYIH